jgi:adhesin transport system outer membrane protein
VCAAGATAQTVPTPPSNSLVVDPQQGATPRPVTPTQPTPSTATPLQPRVSSPPVVRPPVADPITIQPVRGAAPDGVLPESPGMQARPGGLPAPSRDPLRIDPALDPVLRLSLASADPEAFRAAIRSTVERNPSNAEAVASRDIAVAQRNEARTLELPVIDVGVTSFKILDRDFSNDPRNVLERSRPRERTDATFRLLQPVFDFGTAQNRIKAGNRRIAAGSASIDDAANQVALRGVASWYQVFGYRALVTLSETFVENQAALRVAIQDRIRQGYAAPADVAQVESYIAAAQAQLANYRRQLASAEAQYTALTGAPPPETLGRAPAVTGPSISQQVAQLDAETIPAVRSARLAAEAARFDARSTRADALPGVAVGLDAGRYGVFENARDYDIRGSVTVSHRFLGGANQRTNQAFARARGAEAVYERVRQDAVRDAAIAWADVTALQESEAAIRGNYIATRQSRDVLAERFRVARGTLFDLLATETNYFNVAARYVETVTELDIARYNLLARRGKLLEAFGIAPAELERK